MKVLHFSISKASCRYWLFLFFILLNFNWQNAQAQSGTSVYDAFLIPVNGCGYSSFTDYQNNGSGFSNNYGQSSPDVWYSFTLGSTVDVSISLCNSNFDTYLHLLDFNGNLVSSDDDGGCGNTSAINQTLGAGTYYVVVEGYSSYTGDFALDFVISGSGTPAVGSDIYNPVYAGSFSGSGSYTDTRSNADDCLGNNIGQVSNDIYYQFTLGAESEVTLSHCGSGFDTYMLLLDGSGSVITTNDDESLHSPCPGVQSYIQMTLPAGTYYVVSEGYSINVGNIVTNINVTPVSSGLAPVIAYVNPASFTVGTAISPVGPSNTGGAVSSAGQSTTTLAGSGFAGSTNGTGTGASFNNPLNAAVDAAGNVYVADAGNSSIRKITPSGVVTTFAGSGSAGYADGVGTSASFQHPSYIAIDASGNLFVSDQHNNRIRKISPSGVVSTFAGSGTAGSANGTGTAASFQSPIGLAFDGSGNLYVADYSNHKIRKITPSGVVSDFAGSGSLGAANGAAGIASFNLPMGLSFDAAGNLYVADRGNAMIRKITSAGVVSTLAGSLPRGYVDGPGNIAKFNPSNDLVLDGDGNIYVADQSNNMVRKVSPTGEVSTFAGTTTAGSVNGTGAVVRFNSVFGIARGGDGAIYVIESGPNLIRKMTLMKAYTISPALPAGLVFNDSDGTISGTPTVVAPLTTYTITAYNSAGSHSTTLSFAVNAALACVEASQDQNYITTYVPREAGLMTVAAVTAASCDPTKVQTGIQYFDGLGRPLQTVQVKGSPDKKDIVVPIAYDAFGRESKKYLPYASIDNNGAYKADGLTKVIDYYAAMPAGQTVGFNTPFSESRFEPSPLNRVLEQGAPGASWQIGGGHTIGMSYETNVAGEVNIWTVSGTGGASVTSPYNAGTLYKMGSKDENGNESIEYKDLQGKVLLKKVQDGVGTYVSTYYVYDDLGNLRYVLPPAVSVTSFTESDAIFLNYIYGYHYDGRKRLIKKKIPGKGWESMVYNQLDQVVATQDAMQAVGNLWTFSKYDAFGRIIQTGEVSDTRDQAALAAHLVGALSNWESRDITLTEGYTQESWPQSWNKLYTVNYYDNYDIPNNLGSNYYSTAGDVTMTMTKGLLTATKVRNLESGVMYWTVNYYNERGELRESVAQNHLEGRDRFVNTYKFTGELENSVRTHNSSTVTDLVITNAYTYDHMGRTIDSKQRTGENSNIGNPLVLLSRNTYNGVGQLLTKGLHSTNFDTATPTFAETVNYTYNPRGWLSSQLGSLFTQKLWYNEPIDGVVSQYNGNISRQEWGLGKYYNYTYDKLNRLTVASSNDANDERIGYDVMGNISSMERQSSGVVVDLLGYNYNNTGNRLGSVVDANGNTNSLFQLPGTTDYSYDLNGNMTGRTNATNSGNNLSSIAYNYLNLPSAFSAGSNAVSYIYDASGNKLKKLVNGGTSLNNDYIGGIQYESGVLKFISTEAGRVVRNSSTDYAYEYTLADHLGNGRVYFDISGGVARKIQETDYYAFGLDIQRSLSGTENKYQYNGKEKQDLEKMYDYGARFYDPVIGRWNVIDPMSGLYMSESPYAFAGNSPVTFVDEGGLFKINAQFARLYPTLTRMLKYYLPMLKDNKVVRNAFIKTTGMGNAEFDQMVTYGSGPWITPTRPELANSRNWNDPAYGDDSQFDPNRYPDDLFISQGKLEALELAFKKASVSQNGNELGFQMFVTSLTVMHEATHYGFFKTNGLAKSEKVESKVELGAQFEKAAFEQFSYSTTQNGAMDIGRMRAFYDANRSSDSMIGMSLIPNLGSFNFNRLFLIEGKPPKPIPEKSREPDALR
ncbi:hypothetical protein FBD94_14690 [Pedobacter hiemivivus]|uniref:Uncharacterized protein n=1 Tax=Pedobacter hiemivivus TaxID=2530454 RepID=A0A4U1GB77_9SPHI|nr:DUF6443 domain-containing protein [Pedobacter hiemivivus]TKC60159.1 hypothetical protein FBD94_14690 [Pedobacter hiemivivus]